MRRSLLAGAAAALVAASLSALLPTAGAAAAQATQPAEAGVPGVAYRPPVDGPVTDGFRPPATPYGPGNRGLDYAPAAGTSVRASAAGEVVFAGPVGASLHVVLLHADGIRTSYSFLESVSVRRGQRLPAGAAVGRAGPTLHFGARAGTEYLDPGGLFGPSSIRVFLVPEPLRRAQSEAAERSAVARMLSGLGAIGGTAGRAAGTAVRWARDGTGAAVSMAVAEAQARIDELRGLAHYAAVFHPGSPPFVGELVDAWRAQRQPCTPATSEPPRLTSRRLAVLVGGLGSSSGDAAVLDIDTARLGYAPGDVVQFSYRGGRADERRYTAADTHTDIAASARRLRELLERLRHEHPGVPVDIIGHSEGGLVARAALAYEYDPLDPRLPPLGAVITLGAPHHGADLATAAVMFGHTTVGEIVEFGAGALRVGGVDPRGTAVRQMAETSSFIRDLDGRPLPDEVRVVSVAARNDAVVASPRSRLAGAANIVVDAGPPHRAHWDLPGSAAAHREIGLALAGLPPTCQSLADAAVDAVVGGTISRVEDSLGVGLNVGGHWVDRRLPSPFPSPVPKGPLP